mgnify:CR=1 FL=1
MEKEKIGIIARIAYLIVQLFKKKKKNPES